MIPVFLGVAVAVVGLVVGLVFALKDDDKEHTTQSDEHAHKSDEHAHQSDKHAHQSDKHAHHQSDGKLDLAVRQASVLGLVNCEGIGATDEGAIVQCEDATLV